MAQNPLFLPGTSVVVIDCDSPYSQRKGDIILFYAETIVVDFSEGETAEFSSYQLSLAD